MQVVLHIFVGFGNEAKSSVEQIGNRADSLSIGVDELFLYSNTEIEDVPPIQQSPALQKSLVASHQPSSL
nr:hypothetical protein CFP56_34289 [Quercus suber]